MKAFILNSGVGKRMGSLTADTPKCLTKITRDETILSRQLKILSECGIDNVIITTGPFEEKIIKYCISLNLPINIEYVHNPNFDRTNYIYSIYLAREYLNDDLILMHGDLVFEESVLVDMLNKLDSQMCISSTAPNPPKDFKAVIKKGVIDKIGIEFNQNGIAAQPLYKLYYRDWNLWLNKIKVYCEQGKVSLYAENAFNEISDKCHIYPMDIKNRLCSEIDTLEDLDKIKVILGHLN